MDLTALLLSRIQFAFTITFHIIFPSFTIGLAAWLTVLEALFLATARPGRAHHHARATAAAASARRARALRSAAACHAHSVRVGGPRRGDRAHSSREGHADPE